MAEADPVAFVAFVEHQLDSIRHHARDALADADQGAVHKVRVAARRLEIALAITKPVVRWHKFKPLAKTAKKLRDALGDIRDQQVMAATLKAMERPRRGRGSAGGKSARVLRLDLIASLEKQLEKNHHKANRRLSPGKLKHQLKLTKSLRKQLTKHAPEIEVQVGVTLIEHEKGMRRAAGKLDLRAGHTEKLHALRLSVKALRYTLEIADVLGLPIARSLLRTVERMQDHLGAWHDAALLAAKIAEELLDERALERNAARAQRLIALERAVASASLAALREFQRSRRSSSQRLAALVQRP